MIPTLYEKFKPWSEKGSVYIISDTHFDDSDCKLMSKTWPSADEQLEKIKKVVHKNDTLIHLGDVGNLSYTKRIKAYKVLIMGNHDTGRSNFERKIITKRFSKDLYTRENALNKMKEDYPDCEYSVSEEYDFHSPFESWVISADNKLFDEVYEGPLCISEKIILSHEPINLPYFVNIHGHDHAGKFRDGNNLNVATNVCNYTPINLKNEIKNGLLANVPSIHRMTIDNASRNPLHKRGNKT